MCNICNQKQAYRKLKKNLIDVIAEEQAKLGYRKEAIQLYYPLSSLNHFLTATLLLRSWKKSLTFFLILFLTD